MSFNEMNMPRLTPIKRAYWNEMFPNFNNSSNQGHRAGINETSGSRSESSVRG